MIKSNIFRVIEIEKLYVCIKDYLLVQFPNQTYETLRENYVVLLSDR